ncbi:hypothetical protein GLOTRDRAFT_107741 [Gloeophyllum trabeum ATCC 11539]|uniref:RRM domain-containing protein n=1 Tax=Gloeophyllum trabeum (strain ATCC 11539 / FP-39264 / Madison 617) TaxID=670483 RepID=S7RDA6_GLOTA|nr:uncharacterized protein GLOTRDRAFT_107741 [Gloeophyllum trabeum ATCC 11539]EPQ52200.1 hypothetical protein GLOTRDRAFT_107741 [Gloeophyllum trabeum ATCC 11539]
MAAGFNRARKPYSRPSPRGRAPEGAWTHDKAPGVLATRTVSDRPSAAGGFTKLLVSNLHYEITPKDLIAIFGQIGTLVREPIIKYDRSGRSTGVAIIHFETAEEATRAKNQFDGALAKGQVMSITYDTVPPPGPRRERRASAPSSLIDRIQKPALLDRLTQDDSRIRMTTAPKSGPGPIRSRGRGAVRAGPRKPKTAEDLDKELDAFMTDGPKETSAPLQTGPEEDVEMA